MDDLRIGLEELYTVLNRKRHVHPDPLSHLYCFDDPGEQEVAGFLAALFAYGHVIQIHRIVGDVLMRLGPSPRKRILQASRPEAEGLFEGFVYRYTRVEEIVTLLMDLQGLLNRHGSIEAAFLSHTREDHDSTHHALSAFVEEFFTPSSLVARPSLGGASKRFHLYLRWMVRRDDVDPGLWSRINPSLLLMPVDRHIHRISLKLGFTRRMGADLKTVREITAAFRRLVPHDPVRYDFVLARLGMADQLPVEVRTLAESLPSLIF